MNRYSYVYLLASHRNCSLYVGVTSDLSKRVWQHNIDRLVWFEQHESIESAIIREQKSKNGIGIGKSGKSTPPIPIGTICTWK
jgi:putative endonuclease